MEKKKKIKLKETDWYSEEYYGKNLFYRILAEKYEIENCENPDYVLAYVTLRLNYDGTADHMNLVRP